MKTFLSSMLTVVREGTIALAVSVTMISASVVTAAPPPAPAHASTFSDKLLTGLGEAALWGVGAPFPEHMSKGERIARYGAAIGLAVAGGVIVNAALIATAPVWVTGLAVAGGVALVATGLHFGLGTWIADHFGDSSTPAPAPSAPTSGPVVATGPQTGGASSTSGTNVGRNTPTSQPTRIDIPSIGRFGHGNGAGVHR